jgi:hypothetical protein
MEIKRRIDLIKLLPENPVTCEIGVAEGNFSEDICRVWKPATHYLVDNWGTIGTVGDGAFDQEWHTANFKAAKERMRKFPCANFLRGPSHRMAQHVKDRELDLLYIDGDHSFEGVLLDLEHWKDKVKKGGIIAFHDFKMPQYGVTEAVYTFALKEGFDVNFILEERVEDTGAWIKTK